MVRVLPVLFHIALAALAPDACVVKVTVTPEMLEVTTVPAEIPAARRLAIASVPNVAPLVELSTITPYLGPNVPLVLPPAPREPSRSLILLYSVDLEILSISSLSASTSS